MSALVAIFRLAVAIGALCISIVFAMNSYYAYENAENILHQIYSMVEACAAMLGLISLLLCLIWESVDKNDGNVLEGVRRGARDTIQKVLRSYMEQTEAQDKGRDA